jgi:phospholipid-binding lipoprotein MlaA
VTPTADRSRGPLWRAAAVILAAAALLAGCANQPGEADTQIAAEPNNDPLEPVNRQILEVNQFLDRILLRPIAKGYVAVVPEDGRDAVRRVLDNMKEPTVFFNNVLQGEVERAGITAGRLVVNTTVGLAGLIDVAKDLGLPRQPADFGQTLFVWGIPEGPYLILPILGPSNPRDAIGMGVDSYADPVSLLSRLKGVEEVSIGRFVADGVDRRARVIDVLDDLEKNSLDFYAQLRSLSQQHRNAELRRGAAPEPSANFYQDPAASGAAASNTTAQQPPVPVAPVRGNPGPAVDLVRP